MIINQQGFWTVLTQALKKSLPSLRFWEAKCQNQVEHKVFGKCLMFNAHMNIAKLVQDGWSWWSWLRGYWFAWFPHDLANALSLMDSETSALSTHSCPGYLRSSLRPSASWAPHAAHGAEPPDPGHQNRAMTGDTQWRWHNTRTRMKS